MARMTRRPPRLIEKPEARRGEAPDRRRRLYALRAMAKADKRTPEIVQAAETLESELVRLETLARAAQKHRLDSEKNITRAAVAHDLRESGRIPMLSFEEFRKERLAAV